MIDWKEIQTRLVDATSRSVAKTSLRVATTLLITCVGISASASDGGVPNKPAQGKAKHWYQVGQASWYGGVHLQGHKTASGESFDTNLLTCAHRSLPLGSWIRVTNMQNSRSIFVRVNDRGPMIGSRIVDLSRAAANAVGLGNTGRVKLEAVKGGDPEMEKALLAQLQMPNLSALETR